MGHFESYCNIISDVILESMSAIGQKVAALPETYEIGLTWHLKRNGFGVLDF